MASFFIFIEAALEYVLTAFLYHKRSSLQSQSLVSDDTQILGT